MTTDIANAAQIPAAIEPPELPTSSAVVYHPAAECDAVPNLAPGAVATRVTGPAMPVRECPCCNAVVGLMLPSEIVCPRRPTHG